MTKKINVQELLVLSLAIAPLIILAIVYPQLPAEIPVHWGIDGEIDAYGPKSMQFLLTGIGVLIYALLYFIPKIDPKRANIEKFGRSYQWLRLGLQLFFALLTIVTTFVALGYNIDVELLVRIGISILFIFLGNSFGKMKQNYMIGIKTPWTLADPEVWNKTHRLSGYVWVSVGIVMVLTAFLPGEIGITIFIIGLIIMIAVPFIYSYVLYQKKQK